ncbi:MAG: hypothetical protein ACYC3Q_09560 [Gemmatimonadaceae bacterium]
MTATSTDADEQLSGLPARVLRLIDPKVAAKRAVRVSGRVADVEADLVHRRRCAEVVAKYLMEECENGIQDVA